MEITSDKLKRYIKEELERRQREKKDNHLKFWYRTSMEELLEIRNIVNKRIERESKSNLKEI